jgi:hypothetical protein
MTTTSVGTNVQPRSDGTAVTRLRSPRGALGALILLLALPLTILIEIIIPGSNEVTIHAALAAGTVLIALSMFDFTAPRSLTWIASVAACLLAAIFLAQGLAALTHNETLNNIAFSQAIGGWAEIGTISIVMLWFLAVARTCGAGLTMWTGALSAALAIGLGLWTMLAAPQGSTPAELRLLFLLPVAWFLFVSTRRRTG